MTRFVKKSDINPSVVPDHQAIYLSFSWRNETLRGPGPWKFNNTLSDDEKYLANIRETYVSASDMYSAVQDKNVCFGKCEKLRLDQQPFPMIRTKVN